MDWILNDIDLRHERVKFHGVNIYHVYISYSHHYQLQEFYYRTLERNNKNVLDRIILFF